jgi:hypothetical protein
MLQTPASAAPARRPTALRADRKRRVQAEGTTSADAEAVTAAGEGVARVDPDSPVRVGQRATFAIKADGMQFFDAATGEAIWAA